MINFRPSKFRNARMRLSWEPCEACGILGIDEAEYGQLATLLRSAERIRRAEYVSRADRDRLCELNTIKPERFEVDGRLLCEDCLREAIAHEEGRPLKGVTHRAGICCQQRPGASEAKYNGGFGSETVGRFREPDDLEKRGVA